MTLEERCWADLCKRLQRDPGTSEESDTCTLRVAFKHALAFADAEAAAMREALQFYADRDSYYCGMGDVCISDYPVMDDRGDIARQALAQ